MGDVKDPNGLYLFREMVRTVKASANGGLVNYYWPKPGAEEPVSKVSFVKHFAPWDWIIGTGVYTDDVQADFRAAATPVLITSVRTADCAADSGADHFRQHPHSSAIFHPRHAQYCPWRRGFNSAPAGQR